MCISKKPRSQERPKLTKNKFITEGIYKPLIPLINLTEKNTFNMCTGYEFNSVYIVLYSVCTCKDKGNDCKVIGCVYCCKDDTGVFAADLTKAGNKH